MKTLLAEIGPSQRSVELIFSLLDWFRYRVRCRVFVILLNEVKIRDCMDFQNSYSCGSFSNLLSKPITEAGTRENSSAFEKWADTVLRYPIQIIRITL